MNPKLGYYSIGLSKFESKIDACIFASQIYSKLKDIHPKTLLKWHFNDDVFDSYDWTKEPQSSLDELYNKRARELREKYDYIIVSYSGGADSHNMIEAFLRQNLFIDEIVTTHMNEAMKDYAIVDINERSPKYSYSSEYQLQALPRLNEITKRSPNTKIRIFDVSKSIFDSFSSKHDESWVHRVKEELNPIDASRYNYLQFAEFKKQLDLSKKIAIVLGVDKPRVKIDSVTGNFFLLFTDRLANIVPIGEYAKDYTNTTVEYFYWSPDAVDLICKQAHAVKKWLLKNKNFLKYFDLNPSLLSNGRSLSERIIRPIIYTTWNKDWFQADKGMYDWHSEYDRWFIDGHRNTIEHSLWKKGLIYVAKNCRPYITNMNAPDGLIWFEKSYIIGNLNDFEHQSIS